MMKHLRIAVLLATPACLFAQGKDAAAKAKLPDGPGKDTTARVCGVCHSVEVSVSRRESREGWNAIVVNMVERGAKGSDDEFGEVVDYLTEHFPPGAPGGKVNVNTASAADLQTALQITTEQAAAIVKYREAHAGDPTAKWKSVEDVAKATGINLSQLVARKSLVTF